MQPATGNEARIYGGRKVQTAYDGGFLSYVAHFSHALANFSSQLGFLVYTGEFLSYAADFSPTLADFSPTLAKFLFSAKIYLAEQRNSYSIRLVWRCWG